MTGYQLRTTQTANENIFCLGVKTRHDVSVTVWLFVPWKYSYLLTYLLT